MKLDLFILVTIIVYVISCHRNEEDPLLVIDTHAGTLDAHSLSEVFTGEGLAILETTDSSLMGNVSQIGFTKDYIFIQTYTSNHLLRILQFTKNGQFVRQVGTIGHGPNEYDHMSAFVPDTNNKRLLFFSDSKLFNYDFEGNLIEIVPMSSFLPSIGSSWVINAETINNTLWASRHYIKIDSSGGNGNQIDISTDDMVGIFNVDFEIIDTLKHQGNAGAVFSVIDSGIYGFFPYTEPEPLLRDTLYRIIGTTLIPELKLDFSEVLSVNKNVDYTNSMSPQEHHEAYLKIRNMNISTIYRTERYVFAEYYILDDHKMFFYDLTNNKGFNMLGGFTDDIFGTSGIAQIIPMDLNNGLFYFLKNGYDVDGIIDGVNENSNPVVFFLKTKE